MTDPNSLLPALASQARTSAALLNAGAGPEEQNASDETLSILASSCVNNGDLAAHGKRGARADKLINHYFENGADMPHEVSATLLVEAAHLLGPEYEF